MNAAGMGASETERLLTRPSKLIRVSQGARTPRRVCTYNGIWTELGRTLHTNPSVNRIDGVGVWHWDNALWQGKRIGAI